MSAPEKQKKWAYVTQATKSFANAPNTNIEELRTKRDKETPLEMRRNVKL